MNRNSNGIIFINIMRTFLKHIILAFFVLCSISTKAQDRLGFCPLQDLNFLLDGYDERLEKILQEHLSEDYIIRCIYRPSFDPEWVLQVERDPELGHYQIITLSFEKNLWYHKNDTIGTTMKFMHIEQDKALELINLTVLFIENKSNIMLGGCLDCESIQFNVNVCGDIQCGAIEYLIENSLTGRLVKIFDVLKACVFSGTTNQEVFNLIKCLYNEASAYYAGDNCKIMKK